MYYMLLPRNILNQVYRSNGKKPVDYFKFVIDPESFGNNTKQKYLSFYRNVDMLL